MVSWNQTDVWVHERQSWDLGGRVLNSRMYSRVLPSNKLSGCQIVPRDLGAQLSCMLSNSWILPRNLGGDQLS